MQISSKLFEKEPEHVFYQLGYDNILFVHVHENTRYLWDVFETSPTPVYFAVWDGTALNISTSLPYDAFPKTGAKLDLEPEATREYRAQLQNEQ